MVMREKAVSRFACHRSPKKPSDAHWQAAGFWSAPVERSGDGVFE